MEAGGHTEQVTDLLSRRFEFNVPDSHICMVVIRTTVKTNFAATRTKE